MDKSLFGLEGKVALIAGGGRGIGRSSALYLAEAGCKLAIVDIEPAHADAVVGEAKKAGHDAIGIIADVRESSGVAKAMAATLKRFGRVDVLANIIATNYWTDTLELTEAQWDDVAKGTLRYAFLTAQAAAKAMIAGKHGGSIVSIASMSGIDGAPRHVAYGAAKAGLIHMTRSLAAEWGQYGIRVNAVAPGSIQTPKTIARTTPERDATLKSIIPLARRGVPDDIGKVVLFFASDLAAYVTGQTVLADGGATCNFSFPPR
ncbi:MAG: SDR family oxidoreductase [Chloroflexi bacterium]|nr:SDR family oxidoreductase [Chloroflexota bacterium]